jgi:hypothetical protein
MKAVMRLTALVGLALLATTATAGDAEALMGKLTETYNKHDADGLQALWVADGKLVFKGGEIAGAEAIGNRYRVLFSKLVPGETLELRARVHESWTDGDALTVSGTFSQIHLGAVANHGRFVGRAVKDGGSWKLSRMWVLGDPRD